jgi:hypothetical protein
MNDVTRYNVTFIIGDTISKQGQNIIGGRNGLTSLPQINTVICVNSIRVVVKSINIIYDSENPYSEQLSVKYVDYPLNVLICCE